MNYDLTVELDFKVAGIYLQSDESVEFLFLETYFGLETKSFVVEKRRKCSYGTAINRFRFCAVNFPGHCQGYDIFWIYLNN